MQTDLSCEVLQEQHDTHASWLPRACLFSCLYYLPSVGDTLARVTDAFVLPDRSAKIFGYLSSELQKLPDRL